MKRKITKTDQAQAIAQQIKKDLGDKWLPHLYAHRVLRLRTRLYRFEKLRPAANILIQHTLLGIELKIGRQRLSCPDLATARYLSVFARIGVAEVAIPYDITKISHIADELESSWHRMLLMIDQCSRNQPERVITRLRSTIFANIRLELAAAARVGSNKALAARSK